MTNNSLIINDFSNNQIVDSDKYIIFVKMCLVKIIINRIRVEIISKIKENPNETKEQIKDFDIKYTYNKQIDIDKTINTFMIDDDLIILKQKFQHVIDKLNHKYKEKYEKIFTKDVNSYLTILIKIIYSHDHYIHWLNNTNTHNTNTNNTNTNNTNNIQSEYISILSSKDFDILL